MDSLIAASALALAAGDPLGALKRIALRGIAMAQLGEHPRAWVLLRRAARGFGSSHETLARARCIVAEAEIALAMRDLGGASPVRHATWPRPCARSMPTGTGIAVRRLLLIGRLAEARAALAMLDATGLPPALAASAELSAAELALRSLCTGQAQAALLRAKAAAAGRARHKPQCRFLTAHVQSRR